MAAGHVFWFLSRAFREWQEQELLPAAVSQMDVEASAEACLAKSWKWSRCDESRMTVAGLRHLHGEVRGLWELTY